MKSVTLNNQEINYNIEGKGTPIVLLHGFCEDGRVWEDFQKDLIEEKYKVITVDLPGFGKSSLLEDSTVDNMAKVVFDLLQHLKIDQFVLIGHSMGGYVSLSFARQFPDLLIGLGLFHSHPYADTEEKKATRQEAIDFISRQGHPLYVKQLFPKLFASNFVKSNAFLIDKLTYRASHYSSEGIIGGLKAMKDRPDQSQVLKDIECPVLFIIGALDVAIPEKNSMDQTHLPAISSVHLLEKVNHMGMFEAMKQTQIIVRQFAQLCLERVQAKK